MAQSVRSNPAGYALRRLSAGDQDPEAALPLSVLVKSLVHTQRVVQNYRHRGERRLLARC